MKKQKTSQSEIDVHQKVIWPFADDSEGVETHKKSSGYKKSRSFDLRWFEGLRSRFAI